ncbi:hypothetical protein V8C26DRAFT_109323 [Trichoderma gracile]
MAERARKRETNGQSEGEADELNAQNRVNEAWSRPSAGMRWHDGFKTNRLCFRDTHRSRTLFPTARIAISVCRRAFSSGLDCGTCLCYMSRLQSWPRTCRVPRVLGQPFSLAELLSHSAPVAEDTAHWSRKHAENIPQSPRRGKKGTWHQNTESSCCGMPPMHYLHSTVHTWPTLRVPATYSENGCNDNLQRAPFPMAFSHTAESSIRVRTVGLSIGLPSAPLSC